MSNAIIIYGPRFALITFPINKSIIDSIDQFSSKLLSINKKHEQRTLAEKAAQEEAKRREMSLKRQKLEVNRMTADCTWGNRNGESNCVSSEKSNGSAVCLVYTYFLKKIYRAFFYHTDKSENSYRL